VVLRARTLYSSSFTLGFTPLAVTGIYTVVIEPYTTALIGGTANVISAKLGTITFNGAAQTITVDKPGQPTLLTFSLVSANAPDALVTNGTVSAIATVGVADQTTVYGQPGNYYVFVRPTALATGNGTVQVGTTSLAFSGPVTVSPVPILKQYSSQCYYVFQVTYTLRNTGSLQVDAYEEDLIELSQFSDGHSSTYLDEKDHTVSLAPGASQQYSMQIVTYPYSYLPGGNWYITVIGDYGQKTSGAITFSTVCQL
jgi:hypothetical protein